MPEFALLSFLVTQMRPQAVSGLCTFPLPGHDTQEMYFLAPRGKANEFGKPGSWSVTFSGKELDQKGEVVKTSTKGNLN